MKLRSKDAENEDPFPEERKQYLSVGYGGPNSGGRAGFPVDGRFGQQAGLFDIIFEKLGLKEKSRQRLNGSK
jgi:hypothetical protein